MEPNQAKQKKGSPCPKCGNTLRLRPDLIGTQVMCPKCNATFTVGRPADQPTAPVSPDDVYEPEIPLKRSVIVSDELVLDPGDTPPEPIEIVHDAPATFKQSSGVPEDEIELDTSSAAARDVVYEADWSSGGGDLELEARHERPPTSEPDYFELANARGMVRREKSTDVPRWTFFSGVFLFPWQGPNIGRWAMMSFGLVVAGEFFVPTVVLMTGGYTPGSIALPILSLLSAVMLLLSLSCASAFFIAAVQDTADGFAEVQESTLPDWNQWFFSLFSLASLWIISGVLGYPLVFVHELGAAAIPICSLLLFPILLLSAMESGSFLLPYSSVVLASLTRQPLTWLGFYVISTTLVVGWFVASAAAFPYAPYLVIAVSATALATLVLIYARLLGRVAWKVSGAPIATQYEATDKSPVGVKSGKRTNRRRVRRELPPDLDQAARYIVDPPPEPRGR